VINCFCRETSRTVFYICWSPWEVLL